MYDRIRNAMSPAAMLVAVLALVLAGAGVGYTAANVGTNDLENNAVTSPKVKNGTLKAADLVGEKPFAVVGKGSAPDYANGGEGDCVWTSGTFQLPEIAAPGYRLDRFGTVHLQGVAVGADAPGGDALCDSTQMNETEDGAVFTLPAKFRPAKTQIRPIGTAGSMVVTGKQGLPALGLAPGVVHWTGSPSFGALLDGISYQPAGSKVLPRTSGRLTPQGRQLLRNLLGR